MAGKYTARRKKFSKKWMSKKGTRKTSWASSKYKQARNRNTSWGSLASNAGYGMVRSPFPPNLKTVFSYTETINAAQTVGGVPITIQYRANGLYDPRVAAGGIQPRYYDSLLGADGGTAPYSRYRVFATAIKVTCFNLNTSVGGGSVFVAVIPSRSGVSTPSTVDEMAERPYCKQKALAPVPSWKPPSIKHFCKIKTHLGVKDLADVSASAALHSNVPNEEVYWNISLCAVDPTSTASVRYQISITYYTQLYTLADVADS